MLKRIYWAFFGMSLLSLTTLPALGQQPPESTFENLFKYRIKKTDLVCIKQFFGSEVSLPSQISVLSFDSCPPSPTLKAFELSVDSNVTLVAPQPVDPDQPDNSIVLEFSRLECYVSLILAEETNAATTVVEMDFTECH